MQNHPSLQGFFSGMSLTPVPIQGVIMSSKPLKWSFDIKGRRRERNERELSVAGFVFTNVQNYFPGPVRGRGQSPPSPPPWTNHCCAACAARCVNATTELRGVTISGAARPYVLTNGHTGHVLRAPDLFFLRGPQLAVAK